MQFMILETFLVTFIFSLYCVKYTLWKRKKQLNYMEFNKFYIKKKNTEKKKTF